MKSEFENPSLYQGHEAGQYFRKRKLLLFLPLLVLPLLTFVLWLSGRGSKAQLITNQGINTVLPGADLGREQPKDKLGIYEQHRQEAAKTNTDGAFAELGFDTTSRTRANQPGNTYPATHSAEANEGLIRKRLALIKQEIAKPEPAAPTTLSALGISKKSQDLDRMEKLSRSHAAQTGEDPEMKQLNGMLEKIMDIQHPERVSSESKQQPKTELDSLYKAFRAVVSGDQKVSEGSQIKLCLQDTLYIDKQVIPKGQFLFGICQLINQRLLLNIKTIRLGSSILPVDLSVYDLDAMPGINVPEAIMGEALRSGSDNALQRLPLMGLDQSVPTQLAGAGVEAAKGLFSKKVKRVKVRLKADYPVLLRNNQPEH